MNKKILFIDDDLSILNTYRDLFGMLFSEEMLFFASNKSEILEILSAHSLDCIVTDFDIGITSVAGVFHQILTQFPQLTTVPVILATGQASKGMILRNFPLEVQIMGITDRFVPIRTVGKLIKLGLAGTYDDCLKEVAQFRQDYPVENELEYAKNAKCLLFEKRDVPQLS